MILISHAAIEAPSSVAGQHNSFRPRHSHGMRIFDGNEMIHMYSFEWVGV